MIHSLEKKILAKGLILLHTAFVGLACGAVTGIAFATPVEIVIGGAFGTIVGFLLGILACVCEVPDVHEWIDLLWSLQILLILAFWRFDGDALSCLFSSVIIQSTLYLFLWFKRRSTRSDIAPADHSMLGRNNDTTKNT